MSRCSTRVALLMLVIGQIMASESSSSNCQHQNALHERMDTVEKRLDEAVQMLESEVSLLLDALEGPDWSPLLDTPDKDILEQQPPA